MGKRTDFERNARDFYPTLDPLPVKTLRPFLKRGDTFIEPFAGDGALRDGLVAAGLTCIWASDIAPLADGIHECRAEDLRDAKGAKYVISNTPWPLPRAKGAPALGYVRHCASLAPSWLIYSADFMHNVYFQQIRHLCRKIVTVGRVSWMSNGQGGFENAAWYLFDEAPKRGIQFYPKGAK